MPNLRWDFFLSLSSQWKIWGIPPKANTPEVCLLSRILFSQVGPNKWCWNWCFDAPTVTKLQLSSDLSRIMIASFAPHWHNSVHSELDGGMALFFFPGMWHTGEFADKKSAARQMKVDTNWHCFHTDLLLFHSPFNELNSVFMTSFFFWPGRNRLAG